MVVVKEKVENAPVGRRRTRKERMDGRTDERTPQVLHLKTDVKFLTGPAPKGTGAAPKCPGSSGTQEPAPIIYLSSNYLIIS